MTSAAEVLAPVVRGLVGTDPPVRVRLWDGSELGRPSATTITVTSPRALRRLIYAPGELGLARAYVSGELDIDGDIFDALALRDVVAERRSYARLRLRWPDRVRLLRAAARVGALGPPLRPPPEETRLSGRLHSRRRDAAAIAHHYDVSNDFYQLVLGNTMTYSCAYFAEPGMSLDDAQRAKYELICAKLGLRPGMRLLDVGCGWGGMVLHAAARHGVSTVGVTLSRAQAELAEKRIAEAGLAHRVEVRVQDYRDVADGPYDAISSIGMYEHVGRAKLGLYFDTLRRLLRPGGRLLNHGITRIERVARSAFGRASFIGRYVFPDGELHEVGTVISQMQARGLEVRDVESLREHYGRTLRCWVANLEANLERAVALVGEGRARVWRLYMAGSALAFEAGRLGLHQVLAVNPHDDGRSDMPPVRTW
jgi:cyclopropane-fatty-acyl-phospholipid synthase